MATLDNAIWLTGAGATAVNGSTTISEGGNSTNVTGTFTGLWDASQSGFNVSEFGAFGVTSPITATFDFSTPVEDLTFDFQHVNGDDITYDDNWTIYAYDENGILLDSADVIAGLSGLVDETVTVNPDGSVNIDSTGGVANDINLVLPGQISSLQLILDNGPQGTQSGGTGISDLTFSIPAPDTDGDGITDDIDLDDDNDGILDSEEMDSSTPSTITITFDGDEWATTDNTRWELRDPDGNLIASDTTVGSGVEITNVAVAGLGDYTFTVLDDFGDGISGADPASYTIAIDSVVVVDSGANPNFGTSVAETFSVAESLTARDSDGDGIDDHLDLDSDNDGITDNVEAQTTAGYVAPTGVDTDGDGLDDAYDATPTTGAAGSNGLTAVNTDGTGAADYLDTDSDDDGISDADEAGHGISQAAIDASGDADGDGIKDAVDDVVGWDVNDADVNGSGEFTLADTDNDTAPDGSGAIPMTADLDFRDAVPCFTPGTLIATIDGEIPIEKVSVGQLVLTADNGYQPVRWVGHRKMSQSDFAEHPNLRPVILRKGAFGNARKMRVSPQHGMVIQSDNGEQLIRAKHVAENFGGKFARVDKHCEGITYIHIMFDRHELIFAEGALSEAFYPGPIALGSLNKQARDELFVLFPELSSVWKELGEPSEYFGHPARSYMRRKATLTLGRQISHRC